MGVCLSCNKLLSDFESTRKYEDGSFVDLCNHCWFNSDMYFNIPIQEREDLSIISNFISEKSENKNDFDGNSD